MQDEKHDNISIFKDLQPKIIGFIAAIVSLLTFVQSFINNSSELLGIPFWLSYQIFLLLYFILPALLVVIFINKRLHLLNIFFLSKKAVKKTILIQQLAAVFFLLFGYYYFGFSGAASIKPALIITISIIAVIYLATLNKIWKTPKFDSEEKEYLIVTLVLISLFTLFLFNSYKDIQLYADNAAKTNVTDKYAGYKIAHKELAQISRDIEDRSKANDFQISHYMYPDTPEISRNKNLDINKALTLTDKKLRNNLLRTGQILEDKSDVCDRLISIKNALYTQADTLLKKFDQPGLNTATIKSIQAKMTLHTSYSMTINKKLKDYITSQEKNSYKGWVAHFKILQFKGLLWFILFLFVLLSLLYYYAETLAAPIVSAAGKLQSYQLQKETSSIKSYIFLLILLIVPFFKEFTEENVNFDKPFLNIGIPELLKKPNEHTKSSHIDTILRTIHIDSIRIITDESTLKKENDKVLKSIAILGQKSIENPKDRSDFKVKMESSIQPIKK